MLVGVANIHERLLPARLDRVGQLLDTLASDDDRLWPVEHWPAMRFDGGLRVGAVGGHGPVRYSVVQLERGRLVRFRFSAPRGLNGDHWLEAIPNDSNTTLLRHGLVAQPSGAMKWQWPLIWGPLHDALLEDALARAHAAVTDAADLPADLPVWSRHVRLLRRVLSARS